MIGRASVLLRSFSAEVVRRCEGSVLPGFAILAVPLISLVGAGVDYSRASNVRADLRAALDTAVLAGAKDASTNWAQVALDLFHGNPIRSGSTVATPTFSVTPNGYFSGTVTASVPTMFLGVLSIPTIPVSVTSVVSPAAGIDNSCILTLDHGKPLSDVSMNFGGAPNIQLAGCSIRSNTSLSCNGHSGGATASIAAGTAVGCSNSQSYTKAATDIYAALAKNITRLCGGLSLGVTWDVSATKPPSGIQTVTKDGYTEYHVCGDLTLSGTGDLLGNAPTSDSVIVIENGGLNLSNNASVKTLRSVIVLTGNGTAASAIDFPNGNGQGATLSLSPPLGADNPWRGVAFYQDPSRTTAVNVKWGPGATFNADGIVYLPYADLLMSGIAASNSYRCTKFVTNTFNTNGNVSLNLSQTSDGCTTIGMKQPLGTTIHLVQ